MKLSLLYNLKILFASFLICTFAGTVSQAAVVAKKAPISIHVYVALADIETQSIEQVSPRLANGNDGDSNIFWGGKNGLKKFLPASHDWEVVLSIKNYEQNILERLFLKHQRTGAIMVADAYRGTAIKSAILDFLNAASGGKKQQVKMEVDGKDVIFMTGGNADIIVFMGHNGLMDFTVEPSDLPLKKDDTVRDAFVLAEYSKSHFELHVMGAGARPLLMIDGNILPEAFILHGALEGYLANESGEQIRLRAANSYVYYMSSSFNVAERLFTTFKK